VTTTGEVSPAAFRAAVGRFTTGVTVVTTTLEGIDHAMTASAFTSVSLDPLLVLVCVEREARFAEAVLETGQWGVSVLDASSRGVSEWLASRGRPLHGQLDRVPHTYGPHTGAALLSSALATLECRTTAVHEGGDHHIVVGQVLAVTTPPTDSGALLYYRGRYDTLRQLRS
jgi:flavin reductase (DIM6/NTAB) family NADH-FMN oxidoreductase RutF